MSSVMWSVGASGVDNVASVCMVVVSLALVCECMSAMVGVFDVVSGCVCSMRCI